jgi:hypothetical protein
MSKQLETYYQAIIAAFKLPHYQNSLTYIHARMKKKEVTIFLKTMYGYHVIKVVPVTKHQGMNV